MILGNLWKNLGATSEICIEEKIQLILRVNFKNNSLEEYILGK